MTQPLPDYRSHQWPVLRSYRGRELDHVAMPIGGIGTGTVSIGGRGDLRDWEIVNRPAKGFRPDQAFLAIRAAADGDEPFARCLEGPLTGGLDAAHGTSNRNGGLPRFAEATFLAAYPLAQVVLDDPESPLDVRLEAFNPMVPADPDASGEPVAAFRVVVRNRSDVDQVVSVAASMENFVGRDGAFGESLGNVNHTVSNETSQGLLLTTNGVPSESEQWGSLALTAPRDPEVSVTTRLDWAHATWAAGILDFWDDFVVDGALDDREPTGTETPIASLCQQTRIAGGSEYTFNLLLAWHFPNRMSWDSHPTNERSIERVGNWYATRDADAWAVTTRVLLKLPDLEQRTVSFIRAFCESPVPPEITEAALFNTSTLRTQTAFRTDDGNFFGWEGCNDASGCCHGSCTHVWNYEQATAHLFGSLARLMRSIEFRHATDERGLMSFRVNLPLSTGTTHGVAAADGQMGCILKLYREWQLHGDDAWLAELWPDAKRALAWIPGGWDADRDGVMEGCQHNSMDVEYYGPNPEIEFWYLGALRAAGEMARHLGDTEFASTVDDLYQRGSAWTDANLFNSQYYEHHIQAAHS